MGHRIFIAIATAASQLILAGAAFAAPIAGPTAQWAPIFYPTIDPDPINDHATGQAEADIVGTSTLSGFFTQYETGDPALIGDDMLKFRIRIGTEDNPAGFSHVAMIGVDGDLDGTLDAFIAVANSGQDEITLLTTGNKANDTPKDTSTSSTSYSYAETSLNYDWSPVSAANCSECTVAADYDLDGDLTNDYFLSFAVPFVDVVAVLGLDGVTGITPSSLINYVAGTSTNTNSFNQDLVGVDGDPITTQTWTSLDAMSNTGGFQPNPEPGTGMMLGLGLCWLGIVGKKRRRASSRNC